MKQKYTILLTFASLVVLMFCSLAVAADALNDDLSILSYHDDHNNNKYEILVDDFNRINVSYGIRVVYTNDVQKGKVIVSGTRENMDALKIESHNNELSIGISNQIKNGNINFGNCTVYVNSSDLKEVKATLGGSITFENALFFKDRLNITANTAGIVRLGEVSGNKLYIDASTAGMVSSQETYCDKLHLICNTSSNIKLKGISSLYIETTVNTQGKITLEGETEAIDTETSTGGKINMNGLIYNPQMANISSNKIYRRNDESVNSKQEEQTHSFREPGL